MWRRRCATSGCATCCALIFTQLKIEAAELGADALSDIAEYLAYDRAPEAIGNAGWAAEQRTVLSSRQASDPSAP